MSLDPNYIMRRSVLLVKKYDKVLKKIRYGIRGI
jgi:hypothetical protein